MAQPTASPFWLGACQHLWLVGITVPAAVHLCWTCHSACPLDRNDARSRGNHLTEASSSPGRRDFVSAAFDSAVTSRANADRLLRTEPQVRLMFSFSYRTVTATSSYFARARYPDARPSERSLKVRCLLREQEQAGALPAALTISRDAKSRCRPGPHRPGCRGSTPPSCRDRVASIAAMQRFLKPQSTGQHRGDPPFSGRRGSAATAAVS